jgi:putative hydrolase of the HAD superfamily
MAFKGVAFDFGNVISLPQAEGVMEELASLAAMERTLFESLLWANRPEYDRGTLTGVEYYRNFLSKAGVFLDDKTLERMIAVDLKSWARINPGTERLMADIKMAGYKLGILSNMPHEFLAIARGKFPVFDLPHAAIYSCEVGSIKPEERIYREMVSALGIAAEELIFFDDMPVNVEKACSLGIRAFIWKDADSAREELRRLSLPL